MNNLILRKLIMVSIIQSLIPLYCYLYFYSSQRHNSEFEIYALPFFWALQLLYALFICDNQRGVKEKIFVPLVLFFPVTFLSALATCLIYVLFDQVGIVENDIGRMALGFISASLFVGISFLFDFFYTAHFDHAYD